MTKVSTYLLARHGDVLTGRELGVEVAGSVRAEVRSREALVLSFAAVNVASLPFLDELLGGVQVELSERPSSMLVVYGMNESIREHAQTVLQHRDMVLAVLTRRGIGLLGGDRKLRRLMSVVQNLEPEFSAEEVAAQLPAPGRAVEEGIRTLVAAGALGGRSGQRLRRPQSEALLRLAD